MGRLVVSFDGAQYCDEDVEEFHWHRTASGVSMEAGAPQPNAIAQAIQQAVASGAGKRAKPVRNGARNGAATPAE